MDKEQIDIIITGGTIEKVYNETAGKLEFTEANFSKLLAQSRCTLKFKVHQLMLKDSLDITELDRKSIVSCCSYLESGRIIIVHGTDTMTETAEQIKAVNSDKTIVLFGAMIPLSIVNSDSLFNFGTAVAAVQLMPPGVYIAMNGRIFEAGKVKKNRSAGRFEAI